MMTFNCENVVHSMLNDDENDDMKMHVKRNNGKIKYTYAHNKIIGNNGN